MLETLPNPDATDIADDQFLGRCQRMDGRLVHQAEQ